MTGTRGLTRRFRRPPRFDSALAAVPDATRTETEVISPVPDGPTETLLLEPLPEAEVTPEPEPEPLPEAGLVVLPTLCDPEQWLALFGREPAPAPKLGWVDVSEATREQVEEFAGADFIEWLDDGRGAVVHVAGDRGVDLAHMGDRILRDGEGLHVQCTRAFGDWETGEFQALDAAIAGTEAV